VREQHRASAGIASGEQRVSGLSGYGETRRPCAPLRAVIGPHPQGAGAAQVGGLRALRSGNVNVPVGWLRYAIDEEVPATAAGIPEIILADRVAVRVARGEQRRDGKDLPGARRDVRVAHRHHRRGIDPRRATVPADRVHDAQIVGDDQFGDPAAGGRIVASFPPPLAQSPASSPERVLKLFRSVLPPSSEK
jgi:hypothetical protein